MLEDELSKKSKPGGVGGDVLGTGRDDIDEDSLKSSISQIESDIRTYNPSYSDPPAVPRICADYAAGKARIQALMEVKNAKIEKLIFSLKKRVSLMEQNDGVAEMVTEYGSLRSLLKEMERLKEQNFNLRNREHRFDTDPLLTRKRMLSDQDSLLYHKLLNAALQNELMATSEILKASNIYHNKKLESAVRSAIKDHVQTTESPSSLSKQYRSRHTIESMLSSLPPPEHYEELGDRLSEAALSGRIDPLVYFGNLWNTNHPNNKLPATPQVQVDDPNVIRIQLELQQARIEHLETYIGSIVGGNVKEKIENFLNIDSEMTKDSKVVISDIKHTDDSDDETDAVVIHPLASSRTRTAPPPPPPSDTVPPVNLQSILRPTTALAISKSESYENARLVQSLSLLQSALERERAVADEARAIAQANSDRVLTVMAENMRLELELKSALTQCSALQTVSNTLGTSCMSYVAPSGHRLQEDAIKTLVHGVLVRRSAAIRIQSMFRGWRARKSMSITIKHVPSQSKSTHNVVIDGDEVLHALAQLSVVNQSDAGWAKDACVASKTMLTRSLRPQIERDLEQFRNVLENFKSQTAIALEKLTYKPGTISEQTQTVKRVRSRTFYCFNHIQKMTDQTTQSEDEEKEREKKVRDPVKRTPTASSLSQAQAQP